MDLTLNVKNKNTERLSLGRWQWGKYTNGTHLIQKKMYKPLGINKTSINFLSCLRLSINKPAIKAEKFDQN